ncbi:MAG: pilus assembly protein [Vampirovibrionales bacterium]|nr:pilus assembly protein [Vampirovibrionales bacterium]
MTTFTAPSTSGISPSPARLCRLRPRARGQNLAELALTLPFLFVVIFAAVELAHAWQAYEAAKLAALDGAYTAAVYNDAALGETQLKNRIASAGLPLKSAAIKPLLSNAADPASTIGYTADVTVTYNPLCGGFSVPTLSQPIVVIPGAFDIQYKGVGYRNVY